MRAGHAATEQRAEQSWHLWITAERGRGVKHKCIAETMVRRAF
jgi:hypothetical protein